MTKDYTIQYCKYQGQWWWGGGGGILVHGITVVFPIIGHLV